MLILRIFLMVGVTLGIATLILYFLTGNRHYLIFFSRALIHVLFLMVLTGILFLVGRFLGMIL